MNRKKLRKTVGAGLIIGGVVLPIFVTSCMTVASAETGVQQNVAVGEQVSIEVNPAHFMKEALAKPPVKEMRKLADGSEVECWVITTKAVPADHEMGPWAPKFKTDGKDKGGIWFKDGKVYDVDGHFVATIGELYDDPAWNLVREDGSVKVTDTREAYEGAARPDVDPRFNNYVVEVPESVSEWKAYSKVYVIPVVPVKNERATASRGGQRGPGQGGPPPRGGGRPGGPPPGGGPGGQGGPGGGAGAVGVAFNGVTIDPPAPIDAILAAHTIAPFDDHGGHVNPHEGYHYHAAMGHSHSIKQKDGHAEMIGYALDGYGIFSHLDPSGKEPVGLDEFGGHSDSVRGYHYHAGKPADNKIVGSLRGVAGQMTVVTSKQ